MKEVGDPYTERRKVNILVKGATAPQLAATRTSIMQMETTRNDFQAAYTFIEKMEQFNSTLSDGATAFDRNVALFRLNIVKLILLVETLQYGMLC